MIPQKQALFQEAVASGSELLKLQVQLTTSKTKQDSTIIQPQLQPRDELCTACASAAKTVKTGKAGPVQKLLQWIWHGRTKQFR